MSDYAGANPTYGSTVPERELGGRGMVWGRVLGVVGVLLGVVLGGCGVVGGEARGGGAVASAPETESVRYYIGKLPDRDYVSTYGGPEHPRTWYTAAEELGQIGAAAVPALVERLDTHDSYELMLVLYALMLASQDPVLMAASGGDYLQLQTVLVEESNDENRRRALAWWQRWCARINNAGMFSSRRRLRAGG